MRAFAAFVAVLALAVPAPSAAAALDLGGVPGYVLADPAAMLAGIELSVHAGPGRQTAAQSGLAALTAETLLHVIVDGRPLAEAIAARGGSLSAWASGRDARLYLEAQPADLGALAALTARTLAHPVFDDAAVAAARTALTSRIADEESDPRLVGVQMLRASYYRGGTAMPPLGTAGSLVQFAPADVQAFFARWYLRGDAVVAIAGSTGDAVETAARALAAALPAGSAPTAPVVTQPFGAQPKRIVTHRDVGSSYVVLGFGAPALGDRDFAAALVMRAVLSGLFESGGATSTAVPFRAAGTIYGYDVAPAHLAVWLNGRLVEPTVGLAAIDAVLKSAGAKPLGAALLARSRDAARGAWALEALTLDERASAIAGAASRGVDPAAIDAVAPAIARVTAADVQRIAKRYFQRFDVALILPRRDTGG